MDIAQESAKLNRAIASYPNYKDAGFITQHFIVPLLEEYQLSLINQELNKIEVYIISIEAKLFEKIFKAINPINQTTVSRVIWVCVKGKDEYYEKLEELELTHEANIRYLDQDTGILCLDQE